MVKVKRRHKLADYLHVKRMSQREVGEKVGMSQAAISSMVNSETKEVTVIEYTDGEIDLRVRKVVDRVIATSRQQ